MKQKVNFLVGSAIILFVGTFITQPAVADWLRSHPFYEALATATGVTYHAFSTYLQPSNKE